MIDTNIIIVLIYSHVYIHKNCLGVNLIVTQHFKIYMVFIDNTVKTQHKKIVSHTNIKFYIRFIDYTQLKNKTKTNRIKYKHKVINFKLHVLTDVHVFV